MTGMKSIRSHLTQAVIRKHHAEFDSLDIVQTHLHEQAAKEEQERRQAEKLRTLRSLRQELADSIALQEQEHDVDDCAGVPNTVAAARFTDEEVLLCNAWCSSFKAGSAETTDSILPCPMQALELPDLEVRAVLEEVAKQIHHPAESVPWWRSSLVAARDVFLGCGLAQAAGPEAVAPDTIFVLVLALQQPETAFFLKFYRCMVELPLYDIEEADRGLFRAPEYMHRHEYVEGAAVGFADDDVDLRVVPHLVWRDERLVSVEEPISYELFLPRGKQQAGPSWRAIEEARPP